ncbi:MAG TPA: hypothetical protein VIY48_05485 [Candidatus Paceibacterota bacterium]
MTFKRMLKSPGAWFISVGGSHHAIELAREHVFLAVHEYVAHHGWLLYTLGGVCMIVGVPCFAVAATKKLKGNKVNDDV